MIGVVKLRILSTIKRGMGKFEKSMQYHGIGLIMVDELPRIEDVPLVNIQ